MAEIHLFDFGGLDASYALDSDTGAYQALRGNLRWPPGEGAAGFGSEIKANGQLMLVAFYTDGRTMLLAVDGHTFDLLDPRITIEKTKRGLARGFIVRENGRELFSANYSIFARYKMSDPYDGTDLIDYINATLARGRKEIEELRRHWVAQRLAGSTSWPIPR